MSVKGVGPGNVPWSPKKEATPKKGLLSKISGLFKAPEAPPIILPRPSSQPLNPEEKKKVQLAISQLLPTRMDKLMSFLSEKVVIEPEKLSIQSAKEIMGDPRVIEYLKDGEDLALLQVLVKIAIRANQADWESVNQSEERDLLKNQCWNKNQFYSGDIHRAVHLIVNGSDVPKDTEGEMSSQDRLEMFVNFCGGNEEYAKQLSQAAQQGLSASLNQKIATAMLPLGINTGMTKAVSGGVQDIAISRKGNQLLIELSVKFPLSSLHCAVENKPHDITQILGRVKVVVDEEEFKKGNMSSAQFTHSIETVEGSQGSDLSSEDFLLV